MDAIPLSGFYGAMALAAKIVSLRKQNKDDKEAAALVAGMREAIQTMTQAASLITYIQDKEDPLVVTGDEIEELNPAEILRRLADAWDESQSHGWDDDVNQFVTPFNQTIEDIEVDKFNAEFPDEISVADILGEEK